MTLEEFKMWFDGFSTGVGVSKDSTISPAQWEIIKDKIKQIEGHKDNTTIGIEDFQKEYERYFKKYKDTYPYTPEYPHVKWVEEYPSPIISPYITCTQTDNIK